MSVLRRKDTPIARKKIPYALECSCIGAIRRFSSRTNDHVNSSREAFGRERRLGWLKGFDDGGLEQRSRGRLPEVLGFPSILNDSAIAASKTSQNKPT
jgi:hypothetical protein